MRYLNIFLNNIFLYLIRITSSTYVAQAQDFFSILFFFYFLPFFKIVWQNVRMVTSHLFDDVSGCVHKSRSTSCFFSKRLLPWLDCRLPTFKRRLNDQLPRYHELCVPFFFSFLLFSKQIFSRNGFHFVPPPYFYLCVAFYPVVSMCVCVCVWH